MTEYGSKSGNYTPDDRGGYYSMLGDVLAGVAARCGVAVDDTTRMRWRQTMGLMREYDTFADEMCASPEEAIDVLQDYSLFEPRYPALSPAALGQPTFDRMLGSAAAVLALGQRIAQESDIETFIGLRVREAHLTIQAVSQAATELVRRQPTYPECLWRFEGLGSAANLADSILDARRDYGLGKSNLPPTAGHYRRLAQEVIYQGWPHISVISDFPAMQLRARMVGVRIVNRLRNGVKPYSNANLPVMLGLRSGARRPE